jgi:hypothetical protein
MTLPTFSPSRLPLVIMMKMICASKHIFSPWRHRGINMILNAPWQTFCTHTLKIDLSILSGTNFTGMIHLAQHVQQELVMRAEPSVRNLYHGGIATPQKEI